MNPLPPAFLFLEHARLQSLFDRLLACGYDLIGPQVRGGTIVYDRLQASHQLPWGVIDQQSPGRYRLVHGGAHHAFAWANSEQAIKPHLFTPRESLWRVTRDTRGRLAFVPVHPPTQRLALFGVRPCDVRAMLIQDRLFVHGPQPDPRYSARRVEALVLVVNCTRSAETCFCTSAGGTTRSDSGHDVALTETDEGFVVEISTRRGAALMDPLQLPVADPAMVAQAARRCDAAARQQQRHLPPAPLLRRALLERAEHPHWHTIAARCTGCGNCTQVCPTCFCHEQREASDPDGMSSVRYRTWDSCFSLSHSTLSGHYLRESLAWRYRQWLTHKWSTWFSQFGVDGCTGCGRCLTWCPVGIDMVEEVHQLCKD